MDKDVKEKWIEFENTISPSNFDILPLPIELYESQKLVLSSI